MQQPARRFTRGLGRLGHFIPHLLVAIELFLVVWKIDALLRFGATPVPSGGGGASLLDWALGSVLVAFVLAPGVVVYLVHEQCCDICAFYRRHPRYSPLLMAIGRPWWTVGGPRWPALLGTLSLIVIGIWVPWALPFHYLFMAGYWIGYIGYMRIGAGRVGEGEPRPVEVA